MARRPILLIVDDEPDVLGAVELDLRRHYIEDYRIVKASSGEQALSLLGRLRERGDFIALLLVDQRMPRMTGIEFLETAISLAPDAKRVLLTAYSDTDVAIRAINRVRLDYYLTKPWDPPEDNLYPVLDDLLADWRANHPVDVEGIQVIGTRWSPETHELKEFLARHQVPFRWVNVEASPEVFSSMKEGKLPIVVLPDGVVLTQPDTQTLATHIGLQTRPALPYYDLAIIGGGPAGLAAAVYGASEGLSTVIIERHAPGGQAATSSRIENYLGFPVGLSGADLTRRAVTQAKRFGAEILAPQEVAGITLKDPYRIIHLKDGAAISSRAVLVATGVSYHKLDAPGIERLSGAGVYYGAALSEALEHQGEEVFIGGGANSAGQAAVHFARFAKRVTLVARAENLSEAMSAYLVNQIAETPNINVSTNTVVVEVHGETHLNAITVRDRSGSERTLPADALFVFIGARPQTDWLDGVVARSNGGYILTGNDLLQGSERPHGWALKRTPYLLETSVPGIFVAGDVRYGSIKRVASAVGEGAISVQFVHQYLGDL